jgi:hypothetical protein
MIKPITYYIDTPNIHAFCQVYGDYAQNLGQADKTFLVATIAAYAAFVTTAIPDEDEVASEVYRAFEVGFGIDAQEWFESLGSFVGSLSWSEMVRMIQALVVNI